jgi:murein DD-endopeptidase MepM/ murein hydrolase activator NlpD
MKLAVIAAASLLLLIHSAQGQDNPNLTIHVVQRGETLFRIAQAYGVSMDDLALLNSLTNINNIEVGQRLLIPSAGTPQTHTVQPGETLQSIGALYGVSFTDLAALNRIADPNSLYVGQVLTIVPGGGVPDAMPQGAPLTGPEPIAAVVSSAPANEQPPVTVLHTVLQGETLFRIALSYGSTVNEIVQANSLSDPEVIYAGQTLIIPNVAPPHLAMDFPAPVTNVEVLPLILVEGQTGRFRISTSGPATLSGTFLNAPLHFAVELGGARSTALVGVPVGTPAGIYPLALTVTDGAGAQAPVNANLQIVMGGYGLEDDILLIEDRSSLLDPAVEDAELNALRPTMSDFNPERYFDGVMGLPAAATVTSAFGNMRSYNGGAVQRLHAGTDFGGAPGTPIVAPAAGRVVLADTLNVRGIATVIDHGWGVYSGYWHQTERTVQLGDMVSAGQVIGTIGATGRVSGPHLHWEVWVNGVPVDPMQWAIQSFS